MARRSDKTSEFTAVAEGLASTAGSAALRRVRSLADMAPNGRMFAAIATLSEMSKIATSHLEAAEAALGEKRKDQASLELAHAIIGLENLAGKAQNGADMPVSLPKHFRKVG